MPSTAVSGARQSLSIAKQSDTDGHDVSKYEVDLPDGAELGEGQMLNVDIP